MTGGVEKRLEGMGDVMRDVQYTRTKRVFEGVVERRRPIEEDQVTVHHSSYLL